MSISVGDTSSILFQGLNGFWQRFFKDSKDLEAYYQASEIYLGQVYLDLLSNVLNVGLIDTPVFNKEYWKMFSILETETQYRKGAIPEEDRFAYDMPGSTVRAELLQNTIFAPTVMQELDVSFDLKDDDGFLYFFKDPFRAQVNSKGELGPVKEIAQRIVTRKTGNALTDFYAEQNPEYSPYAVDVQRGDRFRLLAQSTVLPVAEGNSGRINYTVYYTFDAIGVGLHAKVGDILQVYAVADSADVLSVNCYIIADVLSDDSVKLEAETLGFRPDISVSTLSWRIYHARYQEVAALKGPITGKTVINAFQDYAVDYIENSLCVGSSSRPYPLDTRGLLVYTIVRYVAGSVVTGQSINYGTTPATSNVVNLLGRRHVIPGTLVIHARKEISVSGGVAQVDVQEGVDYTVDYLKGVVYQLTPWLPTSVGRCDFEFDTEVLRSSGGTIVRKDQGNIRQLVYWVPEVLVDRFTLYYNYGTLLNRFEASSEHYKAFLRGIMYLYMSGPILERIEAALNLAAGYPVISTDLEVLTGYNDGVDGHGVTGQLSAITNALTVDPADYVFTVVDEGGSIIFEHPANTVNKGVFTILSIDTVTNSVVLRSTYGFVTENPIAWTFSREYVRVVTTTKQDYYFPYYVPLREELKDAYNFNRLSFNIFEGLTTAFRVTDYVEDPNWWHGKYIPQQLWAEPERQRRLLTTLLYEHVLGAADQPCIGDPGFYVGADEQGVVVTPTDNFGNPVSLYRHKAAYVIFNHYLKMHMFYIEIARDLPLTRAFRENLTDLILVVKPSYTVPYVEPGEMFIDNCILTDDFNLAGITFNFGGETDDGMDSLHVALNQLNIGDISYPWVLGEFFRYINKSNVTVPGITTPVLTGDVFTVPGIPVDAGMYTLHIAATVGGQLVLEGRDYKVMWLKSETNAWEVEALTDWDLANPLLVTYGYADKTQPPYDTTDGWTPLFIGGDNPAYNRAKALNSASSTYSADMLSVRSEFVDRPLQLTINDGAGSYTYP